MKNKLRYLLIFLSLSTLFSKAYAQDTTWTIRNYYSQQVVDFLYENCPNRLIFEFKQNDKPLKINDLSFEIKNGELILGNTKGEFKIIPNNQEPIEIFAKVADKTIAHKTLVVKKIEPPKIYLSELAKGNPLSLKDPINLPEKLYLVA
ncbi:MAG: hypothetical protein MUE85_03880 [Microscillaceae bacterium]|jgi:hypothetical protein|nr:hypothetical protein [Microscillaceae bacterium]